MQILCILNPKAWIFPILIFPAALPSRFISESLGSPSPQCCMTVGPQSSVNVPCSGKRKKRRKRGVESLADSKILGQTVCHWKSQLRAQWEARSQLLLRKKTAAATARLCWWWFGIASTCFQLMFRQRSGIHTLSLAVYFSPFCGHLIAGQTRQQHNFLVT